MNRAALEEKVRLHALWLGGRSGGHRADFIYEALVGADFCDEDLTQAIFVEANLTKADFRRSKLVLTEFRGANLSKVQLPSPTMVLLANWGELSDELTSALMRFDASSHPQGEKIFAEWAKGGPCPYINCRVQRAANFLPRKECWGLKHKPMTVFQLMDAVLKEKCKGWK